MIKKLFPEVAVMQIGTSLTVNATAVAVLRQWMITIPV